MPGRILNEEWDYFQRSAHGKGFQAKCNFCSEFVSGKLSTMANHLATHCKEVRVEVQEWAKGRQQLKKEDDKKRKRIEEKSVKVEVPVPIAIPVASPGSSSSTSPAPKRQTTFQVTSFGRVSKEEQLKHDMQWTRVVVSANLPFVIKRNRELKTFCADLRGPNFRLPSERRITKVLLPALYKELQSELKATIQGKCASLLVDGWSTVASASVLGFSVVVEGKSHIVDMLDPQQLHTIINMVPVVVEQIRALKNDYDCTVTTLVADNENKMSGTRRRSSPL